MPRPGPTVLRSIRRNREKMALADLAQSLKNDDKPKPKAKAKKTSRVRAKE